MTPRCVVAVAVVLCGCKSGPPEGALNLEHTTRPGSPVQVSWQEVSRDAKKVELIARVERISALTFPLEVSLRAPRGATLAKGRARFTLAPNAEREVSEEALTFTYDKTPDDDLELLADGVSVDVGIHATAAYRFGRAPPQHEVVPRSGPELLYNGKSLGRSVPISPTP